MSKTRVATIWLDGCSGCHMSLLDMDERLLDLADRIELVYGPLVDLKSFPADVDVTLIEGAVSTEEDVEKVKLIRASTKILVSLGDCAVTGNILAMRDLFPLEEMMTRVYDENATIQKQVPTKIVPKLLEKACPVHEVVDVDIFVPGCPPKADTIVHVITELLEGRTPETSRVARFGA